MSKKRVFLTLEQRVQVIKLHDNGKSERKLAVSFNCSKTQINKIIKEKTSVLKEWEDFKFRGIKRSRIAKFSDINTAVLEWLKIAKATNIPLSGPLIKQKATEIADALGIKDFSASNGWLDKFRTRHKIVFRALSGEVDIEQELCEDWFTRLPLLLSGYEDKDIFNMDETGLLFRALPTKSMIQKSVESKGGNIAEERLTLALCISATGEKETPLVIWKSKKPSCFKGKNMSNLGVNWTSNSKAWMTTPIFEQWLINFDDKMRKQERNVLLVLDNAACHPHKANLSNVKLLFLPPNTMVKLQPLDHGVIKWFKNEYRSYVLQAIIARIDESTTASELAKKITVSDAVEWIKYAWTDVSSELIRRCFYSCGMTNSELEQQIQPFDETSINNVIRELSRLAGIEYDQTSLEYENNIECCNGLGDNWETRLLENIAQEANSKSEDGLDDENSTEIAKPVISAQDTLHTIDELMIHSECIEDDHLFALFSQIKQTIEKYVITKKLENFGQTELASFSKEN